MPSTIKITFNPSLRSLQKKFNSLDFGPFMQEEVKKLSFMVEAESKKVTPVDTGRLRASISVDLQSLSATIAPHVYYDYFVHEGTRFMAARPFMLWGAELAGNKFDPIFEKDVELFINKKIR